MVKRYVTADGSTVWCDTSVGRFHDPVSDEDRLIAELRDVSVQVETRRQLARTRHDLDATREGYRLLFENTPFPILMLDLDAFGISDANPAAAELFGYPREELLALAPEALWESPGQFKQQGRRLLAEDRDLPPMRARLRHRGGHLLEVEVTAVRIDHLGRAARILLLRDERDGDSSRRAFDRPLPGVGTPRAMLSLAHLLEALARRGLAEAPPRTGDEDRLRQVATYARELALHIERLQSHAAKLEPLDLRRALRDGAAAFTAELGPAVRLEVAAGDLPLPVHLAAASFDRLLHHLLAALRDAMSAGGSLRLTAHRAGAEGDAAAAHLRILGEGLAVSARELARAIGPLDPVPADRGDLLGNGIGLTFAAWMARTVGGDVRVEPIPGGATVVVELPLAPATEASPSAAAAGRSGFRVLVVDDDDAVRFVVEEMLRAEGHLVVGAGSSEDTLERLASEPAFDLVIADATIPSLSSDDLLSHLGSHGGPALLVISGYLNDTLTARGLIGRDVPFLAKPFTAGQLADKLATILGDRP